MIHASTPRNPERSTAIWRWVFLCCQTALLALLALATVELRRGHSAIEGPDRPLQVVIVALLSLTVFLLCASPFFFRRVGAVAVAAWVSSLVAIVSMVLPIF